MIAIYDFLWLRLADYAAKYQSGADIVADFNTKIAEVQLEVFNDFSPLYDENEKIKSLLDFWVRQQAGTSQPDGSQDLGTDPEIVARPLGIGYTDGTNIIFGIPSVAENELAAIGRIPQRNPNVTKKIVYYRFNSPNELQFYPAALIPYFAYYLIYPSEAHIAFTYTSTADEDIMMYDPANSQDLEWPDAASNLILYKMLEKYGVSVREQLLQEYSKFGFVQNATAGATGGKAA